LFCFAIPLFCALLMLVAYKFCALLTQLLLIFVKKYLLFAVSISGFVLEFLSYNFVLCSIYVDFLKYIY
jgi:hypothetical protein